MLKVLTRRLGRMALTMLAMSFAVFAIVENNPDGVALKAIGQFSTAAQRAAWLAREDYYLQVPLSERAEYERDGYALFPINEDQFLVVEPAADGAAYPDKSISQMNDEEVYSLAPVHIPFVRRYLTWLGDFVRGDFGFSYRFKRPVEDVLWPRLANTGILILLVMLIMVPLSLALGVLAGMREGSWQDRIFSLIAITTTSVPEFASAVFFVFIFVFTFGLLPGTSTMLGGFSFLEIIMPVAVLVLYGSGYIARITRASMAQVMHSPYIRTAILKGLPYKEIIIKHALRNALITPVTVIMLQIPWLLSGVIVVEYFFAYKGFGTLLWEAADTSDPFLIEACAMVTVVVVVSTQLIADFLYTYLNPRIRFQ